METEKEHFSWLSQKQLLVERYTKEKWEWGIPLHRMWDKAPLKREGSQTQNKNTLCVLTFCHWRTLKWICFRWTMPVLQSILANCFFTLQCSFTAVSYEGDATLCLILHQLCWPKICMRCHPIKAVFDFTYFCSWLRKRWHTAISCKFIV